MSIRWCEIVPIPFLAVIFIVVLWLLSVLVGCSATKEMTADDVKNIKGLVQAMEDAGIAGYVEAEIGEGCVFAQTRWGLDLGIKLRVRAIVRPHDEKEATAIIADPSP